MINWMESSRDKTLEESPGFLINRAALRIKREFQRMLSERGLGVTPEQCVILWRLWHLEGGVQRELASTTFKDMTNLTRILDGMERRNLVVRRRDAHDRRCSRVFLTDEGRTLQQDVLRIAAELAERAYQGLTEEEIQKFKGITNTIYANLNHEDGANPAQ